MPQLQLTTEGVLKVHAPPGMAAPPGLEAENPLATAALRARKEVLLRSLAKKVSDSVVELPSDCPSMVSMKAMSAVLPGMPGSPQLGGLVMKEADAKNMPNDEGDLRRTPW